MATARDTPLFKGYLVLIDAILHFNFSITLVAVTSFSTLCRFFPTHPPCFLFVLGTGKVSERFISFDVPVLSRVFGCGNKLFSWPKTNCVVYVLLAGTITSKFSENLLGPKTWETKELDQYFQLRTKQTSSITTATIPYAKGTSETIQRILQPYNIRVAHKPITTLRQLLTKVKGKDKPNCRQGAVYKIKCCDCQATYIGETGRNLNARLTEHKRATRNGDINNHIVEHPLQTNHSIDWDSSKCSTYITNYYQLLTLES